MNALAVLPGLVAPGRSRLVVVAGHAVLGLMLFALTVVGLGTFPIEHPVLGAVVTVCLCGAQLLLALGPSSRRRALALLAAILLLSVGMMPMLGEAWLGSLWFAVAAAGLALPARAAGAVVAGLLLIWPIWWTRSLAATDPTPAVYVGSLSYVMLIGPFGAWALYSLGRLPGLLARLEDARAAAAEQAADRERERVARDLHDVFGHSLSAISLKSGLAERLLGDDRPAASRQLEDIEQIAAELEREAGAVAAGRRQVELADEARRAESLLRAAGIATTVELGARPNGPAEDALLGWAVREAATNVLRHSRASRCTIAVAEHHGVLRLEVENDGAGRKSEDGENGGSGLPGLAARARAVGGRVAAGVASGDRFRLCVELPQPGS